VLPPSTHDDLDSSGSLSSVDRRHSSSLRVGMTMESRTIRRCGASTLNIEFSRISHTPLPLHSGLHWISNDKVRGVGNAAGHIQADDQKPLCAHLNARRLSISPPISEPASTSARARGRFGTARTASASGCSPTSGIVSTENMLSADIVAVRFRDGSIATWPT